MGVLGIGTASAVNAEAVGEVGDGQAVVATIGGRIQQACRVRRLVALAIAVLSRIRSVRPISSAARTFAASKSIRSTRIRTSKMLSPLVQVHRAFAALAASQRQIDRRRRGRGRGR